jgi:hypothetical protein
MSSPTDMRLPAWCAGLAGVAGLVYAVEFILLPGLAPAVSGVLSALALMLLGLFSTGAFVGLYAYLREIDRSAGMWAFLLLAAGAFGALVHGGYDLANQLHPPAALNADLPSPIDPRGLLTFGMTGLGLLITCRQVVRGAGLSSGLGYLGYVSGVLLLVLYVGRLIVLEPASPVILVPAIVNGFLIGPAWYIWLGVALGRPRAGVRASRPAVARPAAPNQVRTLESA